MKRIYQNSYQVHHININDETLIVFPLKPETKQKCPLLTEKETKCVGIRTEKKNKLSLFAE